MPFFTLRLSKANYSLADWQWANLVEECYGKLLDGALVAPEGAPADGGGDDEAVFEFTDPSNKRAFVGMTECFRLGG